MSTGPTGHLKLTVRFVQWLKRWVGVSAGPHAWTTALPQGRVGRVEVGWQPDLGRVGEGGGGGTFCALAVILPAISLFACLPEDGPR